MESREMLEVMRHALDELGVKYTALYRDLPEGMISETLKEHSELLNTITFIIVIAGHRFKAMIDAKKIGIQIRFYTGVFIDKKKKLSQQAAILLKIAQLNALHIYHKFTVDREDGEIVAQTAIFIGEDGGLTVEQCKLSLVFLGDTIETDWSEIMATYFFDPERYLDMGQSSEAPPEKPKKPDPNKE